MNSDRLYATWINGVLTVVEAAFLWGFGKGLWTHNTDAIAGSVLGFIFIGVFWVMSFVGMVKE